MTGPEGAGEGSDGVRMQDTEIDPSRSIARNERELWERGRDDAEIVRETRDVARYRKTGQDFPVSDWSAFSGLERREEVEGRE